ncbi:hypothetical protein EXIGLDRAFT_130631 [Exidia glandulosa HHB12029]|uniref:F-box domain-containing protein n=1 Tax=Exidia glandulosa HHB12029 TaxID=1314781 RepID=A0A165G5L1_EXIGL|nr:hypothetical protein EXIGLDRAFT_130631 [Exidia glandulosa HHB12029]
MAQMDSLDAHAVLVEDDFSGRLPVELLAAVFSHLEQPDILRAARVCSRWRAEAKQTQAPGMLYERSDPRAHRNPPLHGLMSDPYPVGIDHIGTDVRFILPIRRGVLSSCPIRGPIGPESSGSCALAVSR